MHRLIAWGLDEIVLFRPRPGICSFSRERPLLTKSELVAVERLQREGGHSNHGADHLSSLSQSSERRPSTRLNSRRLPVTMINPLLRA
jgi:hypothetical protein